MVELFAPYNIVKSQFVCLFVCFKISFWVFVLLIAEVKTYRHMAKKLKQKQTNKQKNPCMTYHEIIKMGRILKKQTKKENNEVTE